ncbi:NADP-dependent aldehyde dehydrogenase [Asanoa hainanensis]|uniref:NADP-dependent aldehyde dehydrogenase n=1 Tax=Asanoa hainanensis TaxID=560556 RepID=A0A239M5Z5_9ACTN|nr:aldehyde dehydrogenase (NADP(+)) [Asanoa hainanensis]SNT38327.1 NADP-dependent aldehyde dehydrogenase [Asanoa hainanensis]
MTDVASVDPRTGETIEIVASETTTAQVDRTCRAASAAAAALDGLGRDGRAAMLHGMADALEAHRAQIVAVADRETALGTTRLNGELNRTTFQLRLFAGVLCDGGYLEAIIDHARDTPMGPQPDLRRMLVPLGPVAVFGASNFPLAFSVPGGDTASALAAGCPVIIKAHGSHPATSQLCFDTLRAATRRAGAPDATLSIVHGVQAGIDLVSHPAVRVAGFTGSTAGARALLAAIDRRPDPIPFYGELSSLNPMVVTPAAAADRAPRIGKELAASVTLGAGQFCTKPGLVFVPAGPEGDALVAAAQDTVAATPPMVMLNRGIAAAYERGTVRLGAAAVSGMALVLTATAANLPPETTEECFGPVTVIVRYTGDHDLFAAIEQLPPSLTVTIHRGPDEIDLPSEISQQLQSKAGRIVYDGYPTGVAVAWAQHHGGPWPATNTQHTSVGPTAIRRFLRPMAWQNAPADLVPRELADDFHGIPRRVDGTLHLAAASSNGGDSA